MYCIAAVLRLRWQSHRTAVIVLCYGAALVLFCSCLAPQLGQYGAQVARRRRAGRQDRVIIFTNTKRMCEQLAQDLWQDRINCATIHGDREQRERDQALRAFKTGRCPILAATDVAARGLDIKGVQLVVNFDVATSTEDCRERVAEA